jgi:hypothetical protein
MRFGNFSFILLFFSCQFSFLMGRADGGFGGFDGFVGIIATPEYII